MGPPYATGLVHTSMAGRYGGDRPVGGGCKPHGAFDVAAGRGGIGVLPGDGPPATTGPSHGDHPMQRELPALARKRIAAAAVARLDASGLYDCDYANLALAIVRELGMPIPRRYDLDDVVGRIGDLVALRLEAACN